MEIYSKGVLNDRLCLMPPLKSLSFISKFYIYWKHQITGKEAQKRT